MTEIPQSPVGPPTYQQQMQPPPLKSDRGGVVLALGILGIVVCFICGIIAWVMGKNDLRAMDEGAMDPSGRGLTEAGKICGMVGAILRLVAWGIWLLVALLMGFGAVLSR